MRPLPYYRKSSGFSLVELMVVISIIAILMALGAVSYTTAQQKARDAARRTDMKALQDGFEQYYTVNGGYNATCSLMAVQPFIPAGLPVDPQPSTTTPYFFSCSANDYTVCAHLENEKGNADATGNPATYGNSGDEEWFCVQNQQ